MAAPYSTTSHAADQKEQALLKHQIRKVRRDIRRRTLTLSTIESLSSHMLRLTFTSPDLADFASDAPDDHIKLFFPSRDESADGRPVMRDFTPRCFDTARGILAIDFALHDAGPATEWAASAQIGNTLEIGGPRGSAIVLDDFDWYLLIGDETALPAIGRRVEELRAGVPVATFVLTSGPEDVQSLDTRAAWAPHWIFRDCVSDDAGLLLAALADHVLPPGDGFVWIAAEASVARTVRHHVVDERGHPREWVKAAGYWSRGRADTHERFDD